MPDAPSPVAGPRPEPFTPQTDPAALEDLRARLRATRWPDTPEDAGWSLGTDLASLRELVAYWADGFDWPAQEAALARLSRFRVPLCGLGIHFVHVRAAAPAGPALPLALSHGWPDSFWRYTKVIPLLTDPGAHGADPADAFDVVVPDMPGYGYSDPPTGPPLNSIAVANLWAELMTVLGYEQFGAAGGDIGSHVSRYLALDHPDRVVRDPRPGAGLPVLTGDPADLTPDERAWLEAAAAWGATEGAYAAMHRTKPQTAAFALTDSPPRPPAAPQPRPRRAFRAVRGARALRGGAARVLPPLPGGSHELSATIAFAFRMASELTIGLATPRSCRSPVPGGALRHDPDRPLSPSNRPARYPRRCGSRARPQRGPGPKIRQKHDRGACLASASGSQPHGRSGARNGLP